MKRDEFLKKSVWGSYNTWEKAEEVGKGLLKDDYKSYTVVDLLDLVNQPEGEKVGEE